MKIEKNDKKIKKSKIIIIIIILMISIFFIFLKNSNNKLYQDILFLKYLKSGAKEEIIEKKNIKEYKKDIKEYKFNVKYKELEFKNINLIETINKKTLINEKIAPGVEGTFKIIITANADTRYYVEFKNINEKPKNLKFENLEKREIVDDIEEFNNNLNGKIKKGEEKVITIHWFWEYENKEEGNIQDTKDSLNIDKYQFNIKAYGEKEI